MLSTSDALQIVGAGVVVLIALCQTIAWIPAKRRYPGGHPARLFTSAGLLALVWDPGGLGVLGAVLIAMGAAIWWEGQPEPELPRPRRVGFVVAAAVSGLLTLATIRGWGVLDRVPEEVRVVGSLFVAGVCTLGTLAIADRARVTFREALRRRLRQAPDGNLHQ